MSVQTLYQNIGFTKPASFRLRAREKQVPTLAQDYMEIQDMYYLEPLEFADVLQALLALENEINALRYPRN